MASTAPAPSGLPANRVEALCDGVFAIAMTVLVLNIQVPEGGDDLAARLVILWPKLASYATSFIMLAVLWIGHHFQFNYIRRADRPLLWINILFLLAITFLPFAPCSRTTTRNGSPCSSTAATSSSPGSASSRIGSTRRRTIAWSLGTSTIP